MNSSASKRVLRLLTMRAHASMMCRDVHVRCHINTRCHGSNLGESRSAAVLATLALGGAAAATAAAATLPWSLTFGLGSRGGDDAAFAKFKESETTPQQVETNFKTFGVGEVCAPCVLCSCAASGRRNLRRSNRHSMTRSTEKRCGQNLAAGNHAQFLSPRSTHKQCFARHVQFHTH